MNESSDNVRRWVISAACGVSVLFALYTGFRIPNAWATTLEAVSITDGFHRRFVVGTVLRPLAVATSYNYWLFAAFSFFVLAAILVAIVRSAVVDRILLRKSLVIAWLLLPMGAFLFHEVGYLDHVLYLLLFVAFWLLSREKLVAATCVMAVVPMVHEIALLTVLPLFGFALLLQVPFKRAVAFTAVPMRVALLVLIIPAASGDAVATLSAKLAQSNFHYRVDALTLFERSMKESRALYDLHEQVVRIVPVVLVAVTTALAFLALERKQLAATLQPTWLLYVTSALAVGAPGLLVLGGWDNNRWVFFVLTNLFLWLWRLAGVAKIERLRAPTVLVLIIAALVIARIPIYYFDHKAPRDFGYPEAKRFAHELVHGPMFKKPSE